MHENDTIQKFDIRLERTQIRKLLKNLLCYRFSTSTNRR